MTPIKIAIAGIGRAGWGMHCPELDKRRDKFVIVAACDVLPERGAMMRDRYGCRAYTDFDALLNDPDVELVSIATPTLLHVPQAVRALQADKHVFLEKPIALTMADAETLRDAATHSAGRLFFRHNRRFEPAFTHIREIMASGVLGWVYEIKLRRNGYQRRSDWQTLLACGGGQLNNWGPHIIDHALRLLESPVAGLWRDLKRIAAVGDAEDHVKIVLTGENGRVIDLEISGGAALSEPEYVVLGDRGALICQGDTITLKHLPADYAPPEAQASADTPGMDYGFGKGGPLPWITRTMPVGPSAPCDIDSIWDHLYAALREGAPFPITMDEAFEVVKVIEAARQGTPFER
ncbi:MAG: Gfo/Idh/MocA family protein [Candidatus Roseilinea sp.]|uniref:Gfo/Idh/MocA family protein n=1 Tax=Candidatus Roseilinea sp. TaxID=2838777 RepID=UPI00404A8E75